jgi:chromate transporter
VAATGGEHDPAPGAVSFGEATRVWAYIGLNSFGGPAGQIAVMHRELVDARRWIGERRFLHALNYCMVLPGPEAQQLATYIGWLMHGVGGGVTAGTLFVLPGFVAMLALSIAYVVLGGLTFVAGAFAGLQAAVVVLVVQAFIRIARRTLTTPFLRIVAALSFLAVFLGNVPFPLIVVAAGCAGWLMRRGGRGPEPVTDTGPRTVLGDEAVTSDAARSARRAAAVAAVLWAAPVVLLIALLGMDSVFTQEALLFSKAAVVTFGGAYAVLGYIAQQAVGRYGWVTSGEMATGLGLAETTPGPLIMVVQFIGFLAAYQHPGSLPPLLAGVIGAIVTVWVTFVPCFLFIFLGAPYAERLRGNASIAHALTAIGAAVAGVVLSLALWFAVHTLFTATVSLGWGPVTLTLPDVTSVNWVAVAIVAVAAVLVFVRRLPTLLVIGACAALGAVAALALSR